MKYLKVCMSLTHIISFGKQLRCSICCCWLWCLHTCFANEYNCFQHSNSLATFSDFSELYDILFQDLFLLILHHFLSQLWLYLLRSIIVIVVPVFIAAAGNGEDLVLGVFQEIFRNNVELNSHYHTSHRIVTVISNSNHKTMSNP